MEITISILTIESDFTNKSPIIYNLSVRLNEFIKDKTYGNDIQKIMIGFFMVFERVGYEHFFKPRKISYTDYKISKSKFTGQTIEIKRQLSIEIRLDKNSFELFLNSNESEAQTLIIQEVLNYLTQIKSLPKKITDFDKKQFINDLKEFQNCLIEAE